MVFWGEKFQFLQNNNVENFKNLEILQFKRDFFSVFFGDNFWYIHASKLKFSIPGMPQENKESNSHRLIENPYVLPQNWEKMKILWS